MNLYEFLLTNAKPEAMAIMANGTTTSYEQLSRMAEGAAAALHSLGTKRQDRIGILAENSAFWIASYLGILKIGAIAVPLPTRLPSDQLVSFIKLTECRTLCADARNLGKHLAGLPDRMNLVLSENDSADRFTQKFNVARPAGTCSTEAVDEKTDIAVLMFTSGSTGQPNAVKVSHRNVMANTESTISYLGLEPDDKMMVILPFHYTFGTSLLHTHLRVGGTLVLATYPQYTESVLNEIDYYRCTGLAGVPSFFQTLVRNSSFPRRQFPSLRHIQQAGGKLPDVFIKELASLLPASTRLFIMYGQTEASPRLSYLPPDRLKDKLGSIGRGMNGVTLRVLDDAGNAVKPGEAGEIVAEGDSVCLGYWVPDPSKNSFREGRLYTSDMATVDEDGFIYIVGRSGDFIKPSGIRTSAAQIENVLLELPEIVEAAVIGVPHPQLGEAAKAFVVARQGKKVSEDLILGHCRKRLPSYAVPREIEFLPGLPKNAVGKVFKTALKSKQFASAVTSQTQPVSAA